MKILSIVIFWLLFFNSSYGQEKYFTPNGFINFFSHSLIEDIDADNTYVKSIVDLNTNEILVSQSPSSVSTFLSQEKNINTNNTLSVFIKLSKVYVFLMLYNYCY